MGVTASRVDVEKQCFDLIIRQIGKLRLLRLDHLGFFQRIAKKVLLGAEAHYPAIHLAVDIQGWRPDNELSERMHCRSRRSAQFNGFDKAEFNLSEISCTYDRSQSFKFGSASAVQLAIYNKTIQARTNDKLDYMEHK